MRFRFIPESVCREVVLARSEHDVRRAGVDEEVAVLGADGAVALDHFGGLEEGVGEGETDVAAVAVGLVGYHGG